MIAVQVAYASETEQCVLDLNVPEKTTVRIAIEQSGILQRFPEVNLMQNKVGIYSKLVKLEHELQQNDRVEIYRPLKYDPRQRRQLKVKTSKR